MPGDPAARPHRAGRPGHRLIHDEQAKHLNPQALQELPDGSAFLMVQFGGNSQDEVDQAAHRMLDALHDTEHDPSVEFLDDPARENELWQVREAGLGATAHVPHQPDTWEGWEDSAVAPERLGDYLRDLNRLYDEFGYSDEAMPALYGHFGQGCVHTRIPFDLYTAEGVAAYRRFMERAADLVVKHGGSLSGEHGDGQSRGELLDRMFGPELVRAFGELKDIFDPGDRMNPGKVVRPARLDEHLRLGGDWAPDTPQDLFFRYPDDGGSFAQAANRCVGIGKCRQHSHPAGAVMCPSYQVTQEEEHSTRGRARLLFEMMHGHDDSPIGDGWRSAAVRDALDLCLACKGCKTDCPANVDMATYKAEFLAHHWAGRPWRRPRSDFTLGWLPLLAGVVSRLRLASVVNTLSHAPGLHRAGRPAAGVEPREVPLFAGESLQRWHARRTARARDGPARHGAALAGHLHQPFPPARRPGRGGGPGGRRLAGGDPGRAAVLRPDLDFHRTARHGEAGPAAHRGPAGRSTCGPAATWSGWSPAAPRCSGPTRPSSSPTTRTCCGSAITR